MTDEYTLPKDDACYATLEAYKNDFGQIVSDFWQVKQYQKFASEIERWRHCCPGGEEVATEFRPRLPDRTLPKTVFEIKPPTFFDENVPCAKELYSQGLFHSPPGYKWLKMYNTDREKYWDGQFFRVTNKLHDCCMHRSQEQATGERPKETAGTPLTAACENELSRLQTERTRCEEQAQLTKDTHGWQLAQLNMQVAQLTGERDTTRNSLQALREQTAAHPGKELFMAWPAGTMSLELTLLAILALTAGFLLGLPGRDRWQTQFVSGGTNALLALFVYLGSVALLPDVRTPHLLLALTVALLVVVLRTLIRCVLLLHSGDRPPSSV